MDKDLLLRDEAQSGSELPSSQRRETEDTVRTARKEKRKEFVRENWLFTCGICVGRKSFRTK